MSLAYAAVFSIDITLALDYDSFMKNITVVKHKKKSKQRRKSSVSSAQLKQITEGFFGRFVDVGLWIVFFSGEMMFPQSPHGAAYRSSYKADKLISEINYNSIKNAIVTAKKIGLVRGSGVRGKKAPIIITEAGEERIRRLIPKYQERRVWDRKIYLVTYDILESRRKDRNLLRQYLKKMGAGLLQDSVWITPYNPKDIIRQFVVEKDLHGSVIVSDVGKDGSIGDESLVQLVERVYKLKELNNRYIKWYKDIKKSGDINSYTVIKFLSILRDDPQLPFELLPSYWMGDKVYKKVKKYL